MSRPTATLSDNGITIKPTLYKHQNSSLLSVLSYVSVSGVRVKPRYVPDSISYNDLLKAEAVTDELEQDSPIIRVSYTRWSNKNLIADSIELKIIADTPVDEIIKTLYTLSYPQCSPGRSFLILVNPKGGNGKALKSVKERSVPILEAAGCSVDVKLTEYPRHARDIAKELDIEKYDIIVCASGDGVPYEVFNGLYERKDRAEALNGLVVTQLPCGSGNAMSESCHGTKNVSEATRCLIKSPVCNIDLMAVTQDSKTRISFLSQTLGMIANADPYTEYLRFLGPFRFDLGVVYAVLCGHKFPCDIAIKYGSKTKDAVRNHYNDYFVNEENSKETTITEDNLTLKYDPNSEVPDDWEWLSDDYTSHISFFYTGKMPMITHNVTFFPAALPNDGYFDVIMMDSRTPLSRQVPILLSLDSGKHVNAPEVYHTKAAAYRLRRKSGTEGLFAIDGERYTSSEVQVEVLPRAGKTLLKDGGYVKTGF